MKQILSLIGLLMITVGFGQASENRSLVDNNAENLYNVGNTNNFGSMLHVNNPRRKTVGTFYLFDEWDNYTVIHTNTDQKFAVRNMNLNLKRNLFESKVAGDSIFSFNFNNIDKFVINGKVYKNYFWDNDNRVYEVVYDGEDVQILKGFKVVLMEGSANPMLNRKYDKYIRKESYFIRQDGKIKPFKLNKKKILKLAGKDDMEAVEDYARINDLSFKKDEDVKKIMEYSESNL